MSASIVRLCKFSNSFSYSHYRWTFDGENFEEITISSASKTIDLKEKKTKENGWFEVQLPYGCAEMILDEELYESEKIHGFFKMMLEKFPKKVEHVSFTAHKLDGSVRVWFHNEFYADLTLQNGTVITSKMLQEEVDRVKSGCETETLHGRIYFKNNDFHLDPPTEGFEFSDYELLPVEQVTLLHTMKFPLGPNHREVYGMSWVNLVKHVNFTPSELETLSKEGFVLKDKQLFSLENPQYSVDPKKGFLCYTCSDCEEVSYINKENKSSLVKVETAEGQNIKTSVHHDFPFDFYASIMTTLEWAVDKIVEDKKSDLITALERITLRQEEEENRKREEKIQIEKDADDAARELREYSDCLYDEV